MKYLFILITLVSCASYRPEVLPPFVKEEVCSNASLSYLQDKQKRPVASNHFYTDADIHERMLGLEPKIRQCYEGELSRSKHFNSFNLCFVVGFTASGKKEFLEFSSKEVTLSPELMACLNRLKGSRELKNLKEISIIQPYRLFPKVQ